MKSKIWTAIKLFRGELFVKQRDGFYAAKIIFEGDVFVRSVGVFVGKTEAEQDAGNFESVVHLG